VVANAEEYPSPVLAVCWLHSVNGCLVNENGTALVMRGLAAIDGPTAAAGGGDEQLVTAQAGVKLADLHDWLSKRVRRSGRGSPGG
jgi:FAD/FMN-containing dehydrogenase